MLLGGGKNMDAKVQDGSDLYPAEIYQMTEQQLKLREETLGILLKKFGDTNNNRGIYECAEDWCSKQVTTSGLVSYFKAYYNK